MSHKFSAMLSVSAFLDSSCYSEDFYLFSHRPRVPFAFDSDDYIVDMGGTPEPCSLLVSSTMADTPDPQSTLSSASSSSDGSTSSSPAPVGNRATLLPRLAFRKPPRPALPRPLNITAYTKPANYAPYINLVLTPPTENAARSSLTAMAETETLAILRKENGLQFADQVAHEVKNQLSDTLEVWIRDTLFANVIPSNFREVFFRSGAWKNLQFKKTPEFTEEGMQDWLTKLTDRLGKAFKKTPPKGTPPITYPSNRGWSKVAATSAPTGGTQSRKPDLILLDSEICAKSEKKEVKPGWAVIKAFAEVTQNQHAVFTNILKNIVEKAYLMFESQPYRRFVIALAFIKKDNIPTWTLVFVDRSGVISTGQFGFTSLNGITLAMVIYCLSFGGLHGIGIDESMILCKSTGVITHIIVVGQTPTSGKKKVKRIFQVIRPLHNVAQLSGRATHVWLVRRKGEYYVLKDSWPLRSKPFSEIRHLMKINQTILKDPIMREKLKHTYPVLIIGQEFEDDTGLFRAELDDTIFARVHRRIVTKPIGDPLTSFNSKFELCSVLCDVVECESAYIYTETWSDRLLAMLDLKYSSKDCFVCHGDISLNNIVINRIWSDYTGDKEVDSDDINDESIEDIRSESDNSTNFTNIANKTSASNIDNLTEPRTTSDVSSPTEAHTTLDAISPANSTSCVAPVPISAHGLVIDNDNSFSLLDVKKYGYRVNSVSHSPAL